MDATTLERLFFEALASKEIEISIPDPDADIADLKFFSLVDGVWFSCERFSLLTEIQKGRVLKSVRDREKKGGLGQGKGFTNWTKERDINKSYAYSLIELANSADTLLKPGCLDPSTINKFSKTAFIEVAKAVPEVQQMVAEIAQRNTRVTRREVLELSDEWTAMSSPLLPEEVKEKATIGALPPRHLAPLVREMEKLPESHQASIREEMALYPDVDNVKKLTTVARESRVFFDSVGQNTQALEGLDAEILLEEALKLGCTKDLVSIVKSALLIEQMGAKLDATWKKLISLCDRLYVDTGANSPNLRRLLQNLDRMNRGFIDIEALNQPLATIRIGNDAAYATASVESEKIQKLQAQVALEQERRLQAEVALHAKSRLLEEARKKAEELEAQLTATQKALEKEKKFARSKTYNLSDGTEARIKVLAEERNIVPRQVIEELVEGAEKEYQEIEDLRLQVRNAQGFYTHLEGSALQALPLLHRLQVPNTPQKDAPGFPVQVLNSLTIWLHKNLEALAQFASNPQQAAYGT